MSIEDKRICETPGCSADITALLPGFTKCPSCSHEQRKSARLDAEFAAAFGAGQCPVCTPNGTGFRCVKHLNEQVQDGRRRADAREYRNKHGRDPSPWND